MKKTPLKRKKSLKRSKVPLSRKKLSKVAKQPKKGKSRTLAWLKRELDRVFSLHVRKKYKKKCYTCGATGKLQCGHFISRQYLMTRWDERNCRPQCVGCNIYGNGKPLDFEEKLKKEIGAKVVEDMKMSRHKTLKLDRKWYLQEIEKYK